MLRRSTRERTKIQKRTGKRTRQSLSDAEKNARLRLSLLEWAQPKEDSRLAVWSVSCGVCCWAMQYNHVWIQYVEMYWIHEQHAIRGGLVKCIDAALFSERSAHLVLYSCTSRSPPALSICDFSDCIKIRGSIRAI